MQDVPFKDLLTGVKHLMLQAIWGTFIYVFYLCQHNVIVINQHRLLGQYHQFILPSNHLPIISGVHVSAEVLMEILEAVVEEDVSLKRQETCACWLSAWRPAGGIKMSWDTFERIILTTVLARFFWVLDATWVEPNVKICCSLRNITLNAFFISKSSLHSQGSAALLAFFRMSKQPLHVPASV